MSKFAAYFMAAVMLITLGACVSGKMSDPGTGEETAVVQSV